MLTIEEQITRVADEACRQAAPTSEWTVDPGGAPGRSNRVWLAAAAVVVVASLAATWTIRRADRAEPADQPPTSAVVATNVPTVLYPADQTWFVPTVMTGDLQFEVAEDRGGGYQYLRYDSPTTATFLIVETGGPDLGLTADRHVDIAGQDWGIQEHEPGGSVTWFRHDPTGDIVVSADGLDEASVTQVVAGIQPLQATSLPRPPITLSAPGVEVATLMLNGGPTRLYASTDGVNFAFISGSGWGGSVQLGDHAIVTSGATGPTPTAVVGGAESQSTIWGLVRADVATIEFELTDGRVVLGQPQDENDQFIENFFYMAVPTRSEDGFEMVRAVVVRDQAGTVLGRIDGAFGSA